MRMTPQRYDICEASLTLFKQLFAERYDPKNETHGTLLNKIKQELLRAHSIGEVYGTALQKERVKEVLGI
jgi:hypothetical protein